jgi:hypothetical protein
MTPLKYHSGEVIRKGDHVLFHGQPGHIELVADPVARDPETDWYISECGGGVMVVEPKVFGRAFVSDTEGEEDLIFVLRLEAKS